MLAYVFWHQRAEQVAKEEYQEKLIAFHQILQERRPEGFWGSLVLEMAALPWMPAESEVYEDWYLVKNSAALDPLDEAAVTGSCLEPHHQVARLAGNGTGGLYRLKESDVELARLAEIRAATWLTKPAEMSYEQFYRLVQAGRAEQQSMLWQRQMTMGPALEFCIHHVRESSFSGALQSVQVEAKPIFVPAGRR
ncbi:hypothetical protein EI42_06296 [Thermosporothrix hazakensis]|jgi:hypothetical protein|uniref:Uncharacterized protein n=1 Tax=Thermosporothrix hazakensis TaxID=644383 RepID=A0A326TSM5_THEHA|nr:hypothetical protein [Thermosporothrix hazakensis]PZW18214.1 hypothetical protein EI42_06296 [Thermosporothrix hazakensis]GCE50335.1 hypothetical protein KTH_52040 [Thermosporothrix hazakensis]